MAVPDERGPRGGRPWVLLAMVLLVGAGLAVLVTSPSSSGRGGTGGVEPALLGPDDLAAVLGGEPSSFRRVPPPIDLSEAEDQAGRFPFGAVPLPDQRLLVSWRGPPGTGEVTQGVLYYRDAAAAARLYAMAATLLRHAFDLEAMPQRLPGVEGAQRWSAPGYEAVGFRRGPRLVFVGVADATAAAAPARSAATGLANLALGRLVVLEATETAGAVTLDPFRAPLRVATVSPPPGH